MGPVMKRLSTVRFLDLSVDIVDVDLKKCPTISPSVEEEKTF